MSTARHKPAFSPSRRDLLSLAIAAPLLSTSAILRAAEPDLSSLSDITGTTTPNARAFDETGEVSAIGTNPSSTRDG